jgi:HD-GYP domain-containing protein (c-di-GMP phosphodiesterase class II)
MHPATDQHQDHLERLNLRNGLREKLVAVHETVQQEFAFVDRVAVALYDERTQALKTFVHSSGAEHPLENYEASLADAPSLLALLEDGKARVLNDLAVLEGGQHRHTLALKEQGYGSSFTLPFYFNGAFEAFIFFNSYRKHVFTPRALRALETYGHLIGCMVLCDLQAVRTLLAATRTMNRMIHLHDPETGAHVDRIAYYVRLIAKDLTATGRHCFPDDVIERLFAFAALHDLGKIAIPSHILLKPTQLNTEELELMRTHTTRGRQMVDSLLENFGLDGMDHSDILRVVAEQHHEMLDGSGYPDGLRDGQIHIFARIIAVADVFDALTTRRPYKYAWPVEDAFIHLQRLAGEKLDRDCVQSMVRNRPQVELILKTFPEITDGF